MRRILAATGVLFLGIVWIWLTFPPTYDHALEPKDVAFIAGNDVLVTQNPEESTFWKLHLLKEAKKSIEFAVGFTGGPLLDQALLTLDSTLTAKPDLHVHLFISDSPLLGWADKRKLQILHERYPQRFHYLIRGMSGLRKGLHLITSENHIKMLIVDEKYAVVGGTNLFHCQSRSSVPSTVEYENFVSLFHPKAFIDMDLILKGPCAKTLRQDFYNLWALYESGESPVLSTLYLPRSTRYFPHEESCHCVAFEDHRDVVRNITVKTFISGPRYSPGACSAEYVRLISSSKKTVDLMHMYISPVNDVYNSLISASARGVRLTLITNGAGGAAPLVTKAIGAYNQSHLLPLFLGKHFTSKERQEAEQCAAKNCDIYAYEVDETLYHKKVMVIDSSLTVFGSYNLGHKSHYGDYEIIVEVDSPEVADRVKQVMQRDLKRAHLCSRKEMTAWYFNLMPRLVALVEGTVLLGPLY